MDTAEEWEPVVVGLDAGATATRCVVATLDGRIVGRGGAGGANRNSSGGDLTATLTQALTGALTEAGAGAPAEAAGPGGAGRRVVRIGVLGGAGSGGAGRAGFRAAAAAAWQRAGLSGEVVTVTDLEVAYAAGTARPDGLLLLAGTGALAARFTGGRPARRVDGYGWLAGDEGSAVWIGIRALRAALAALDGRGEPTALVEAVRETLGVPPQTGHTRAGNRSAGHPDAGHPESGGPEAEELAQALLAAGFAAPPAALGRLAPAVSAAEDDPVARRIAAAAADRLLHTFDVLGPEPGEAVVLAGSVLLSPGPVARAVRAGVARRTGAEPVAAADGAAGAAALAIARLTGGPIPPRAHATLTGHAPTLE